MTESTARLGKQRGVGGGGARERVRHDESGLEPDCCSGAGVTRCLTNTAALSGLQLSFIFITVLSQRSGLCVRAGPTARARARART